MIFKAIYTRTDEKMPSVLTADKSGIALHDYDSRTLILGDVSEVEIVRKGTPEELSVWLSESLGQGLYGYYTDYKAITADWEDLVPQMVLPENMKSYPLPEETVEEENDESSIVTLVRVTSASRSFYAIVSLAFLMNDNGKTIERLT